MNYLFRPSNSATVCIKVFHNPGRARELSLSAGSGADKLIPLLCT